MFIELVESNRKPKRFSGGAVASVALHTAIICVAIAAIANARTHREIPEPTPIVHFFPRVSAQPQAPAPGSRLARPTVQAPVAADKAPLVAPATVATGIPEITVATSAHEAGFAPASTAGTETTIEPAGSESSGSGPLTEFQVDKPVRALRTNRAPVYPDMLRSRGVEGEVLARFVVSESGRVDMNSVELTGDSSPAFASAVRFALERARFQPAEAGGRRVAQLVEQRFQFKLN